MNSKILIQVAALLILLPLFTFADLPNGECSASGSTCELENDNVIDIIYNVASEEECRQECKDISTGCSVFSYYGPAGVPYRDTCLLFSNCTILDPCEDCYTEEWECGKFCKAPVEGILNDNQIGFIVDVSEEACEAECEGLPECNFFTYHFANSSTYPDTCFLLTELREPITYCEGRTCISGSQNCNPSLCGYLVDGQIYPNGIVVTESKDIDLLLIGSCGTPLAVAVGGGGSTSSDAGSGSGYVEILELTINGPYREFSAEVGTARQASGLRDKADGSILLAAYAGGDGGEDEGGDGYSGGGGDCTNGSCPGGDGGSDGGDGEPSETDQEGGQGSGLDISTIPLRNIVIR